MKRVQLLLSMAVLLASSASGQMLDCPSSGSRTTEPFHFHVQMYRPDTRGFLDLWGIDDFASQSACDRVRESVMKRNLAVVDYFKRVRGENQYEPDRFGTCHADMSIEKTNLRYLTDAQRTAQIRAAEDVRQRVRERLLDAGLTTDNEVVREVAMPVAAPSPLIGGAKLVPMPQTAVAQTTYSASDLKSTKAIETFKPTNANLDLPLVDAMSAGTATTQIPRNVLPAPAVATASDTPPAAETKSGEAAPQPTTATPATLPAATPAEKSTVATPDTAQDTASAAAPAPAAPMESAEEVADSFVAYETLRIQSVLKASSVIADEAVKSKIYDACMQRIQLLSNLRALIEVSGAKSRLAASARAAHSEDERLVFVSKLFGDDIKSHWAPKDATDVILTPQPAVDGDVEHVLRDTASKYNDQQRRRALYVLLSRGQPTEDQQLWLTTIADSFLQ
jgi:hypothetical protein